MIVWKKDRKNKSPRVGWRPDDMGIGLAIEMPKLLHKTCLNKHDIHRWGINEAFASQAVYRLQTPGLDKSLRREQGQSGWKLELK